MKMLSIIIGCALVAQISPTFAGPRAGLEAILREDERETQLDRIERLLEENRDEQRKKEMLDAIRRGEILIQ